MANEPFIFKAVPEFWKSYKSLSAEDKAAADEAFKKFKANPRDPSLKIHKIHRLSSLHGCPVRSIVILNNLRAVFCVRGNQIISLDIGPHEIYD